MAFLDLCLLVLFTGLEQKKYEVDHLLPSSADFENKWSDISAPPPPCLYGVGRDTCTFICVFSNTCAEITTNDNKNDSCHGSHFLVSHCNYTFL